MADYNLGTARGRIEIETGGATRDLGRVEAAQQRVTHGGINTQNALRTTGFALAGVGAAAIAGFGLAVKTAANFEKQISAIGAVSGATEDELEKLRNKALQLGADTAFSASEAANAMEELAKAGISTTDILGGAADATVALAAAGEVSLPEAATIAANAMNQFGLAAKDLPNVADKIAGAANASAIDVSDFGLSMQQAGASAHLVGLNFDDLALAITAMGNAGIKGSDAGTSLKTFLSNLQPTTEKQIGLMKELGLVTEDGGNAFFDAAGHVKSMRDIAGTLSDALEGMTDQQKAMALETIFGSDAIRAAAIIAGEGAEGFDDLAKKIGKVKAADVAAKRLDNFSGSMEQLRGSVETLVIRIGTVFLPVIRTIVDAITGFVNKLSSVPKPILQMIVILGAAAAAVAAFGGALILAASYMRALRETMRALKIAELLTNPVFLVIAAIAALAVGLFILYKRSKAFRDVVDGLFEKLRPAIQSVTAFFQNMGRQFVILFNLFKAGKLNVDNFAKAIDRMFGGSGNLVGPIKATVAALQGFWEWLNKIVKALGGWKRVLIVAGAALALLFAPIPALIAAFILAYAKVKAFRDIVNTIVGVVIAVGQAIGDFAVEVIDQTGKAIDWLNENVFPTFFALGELVAAVVDRIIHIIHFLEPAFRVAFDTILLIVKTVMQGIGAAVSVVLNVITTLWSAFGDNILEAIREIWEAIKLVIVTALAIIRGVIQIVTGLISGDWGKAWEGVKTILGAVWNAIKGIVKLGMAFIRNFIDIVLSAIHAAWDIAWNAIKTTVSTAMAIVQNVISTGLGIVLRFFQDMPGRIFSAVSGIVSVLANVATAAMSALLNGLIDGWQSVVTFMAGLPQQFLDFFRDAAGWLLDIGAQIVGGLFNGIKNAVTGGIGAIGGFVKDKVVGGIGRALGVNSPAKVMIPLGESISEGVAVGIGQGIGHINTGVAQMERAVEAFDPTINVANLEPAGRNAVEQFATGMDRGIAAINTSVAKAQAAVESFDPQLQTTFNTSLQPEGEQLMASLQVGLKAGWEDTLRWLKTVDPSMFITPTTSAPLLPAQTGGDTFNFDFTFGDNADAETVAAAKKELQSTEVLNSIVRAVRSGRRS